MLPVHGVAAVDAGEGEGGQPVEQVPQRFGVQQYAAIREVDVGVVALAAESQDLLGGDEAATIREE